MPKIRILIADDHAVVRAGLRMLIDAQSDMEVVGEAADGPETLRKTRAAKPDVVVLDFSMPGPRTTVTIERLVQLEPKPRILVLTMHDDPAYYRSTFLAGATGYVVKNAADVEVLTAIRVVHRGRTFVDLTRSTDPAGPDSATPTTPKRATAGRRKLLSRRETEVLRLLAQGHTHQEIADQLAVSIKTVETYRKRLHEKLDLKSRAQLFRFAFESGLLDREAALPSDE
jgi:two-component system, NarL family, response regulator NreC